MVEDDDAVRSVISRTLRAAGYQVLTARDGMEGLDVARKHQGEIDLVVTDVVMPRLGGRGFVEGLRRLRPRARVLYVSGFTDDAILRQGLADARAVLLPKPFTPEVVLSKVREVLDAVEPDPVALV